MSETAEGEVSLRPYSVLLLTPDYAASQYGEDTYFAWVVAADTTSAVEAARQQAAEAREEVEPNDFAPLLCIEGHHKDLLWL